MRQVYLFDFAFLTQNKKKQCILQLNWMDCLDKGVSMNDVAMCSIMLIDAIVNGDEIGCYSPSFDPNLYFANNYEKIDIIVNKTYGIIRNFMAES